jgi:WD domain, G-beta repeat
MNGFTLLIRDAMVPCGFVVLGIRSCPHVFLQVTAALFGRCQPAPRKCSRAQMIPPSRFAHLVMQAASMPESDTLPMILSSCRNIPPPTTECCVHLHLPQVWDSQTLQCMKTLEGHEDNVRVLAVGDRQVFSGSWDKTIRVWDLDTLECSKVGAVNLEAVL